MIRFFVAVVAGLMLLAHPAVAQTSDQRVSINDGWRFRLGDPPGNTVDLRYHIRPDITLRPDGADFDAGSMESARAGVKDGPLKPYIMPTGNAFIQSPNRRYLRPSGNLGGEVPFVQRGFDDSGWQAVTLPHDWAITGPFIQQGPFGGMGRLPSWNVGWYRKTLTIPASAAGKSVFLDVDGAMSYAAVWINGQIAGGWPFGYNSWRVDLTPYIVPGAANQIAIRLDNPMESSRWYPGGGIYRNVWLTTTHPVHVAQWGTKISTPEVSAQRARVDLELTVENLSGSAASVVAETVIYAIDGKDRRIGGAAARIAPQSVSVAKGERATLNGSAVVLRPRLWGPPPNQTPNRYVAVTTLRQDGRIVDRYQTKFGIRELRFDPNRGVLVNGEHVRLQGVNQHHDLGALGSAFNARAAERQLDILTDMGVNAIRMSHNPPAPELLDMTDRRGLLVIDESFDVWQRRKTPFDFHLIFDDWHEQDLRAMMRRDRNHPSVFAWSVGNEVGEQWSGADETQAGRRLVEIAHQEDRSRIVVGAMNNATPSSQFAKMFDAISLNYQGEGVRTRAPTYAAFRAQHPGKIIFSSEAAAAYSSRGYYQFPVPGGVSNPVRPGVGGNWNTRQVSAYELFAADFGGTADRTWAAQDQNPFVAGEFVWTGFDYLGEPAPFYESRSSYFGIVDLAGIPKDRFWLYKSRWRPQEKFVHLVPHWTWPGREGEFTPVHAFTSADEAELFVNGKSQGRLKRAPFQYRFRWDYVRYEPGEIKVVTWKAGEPWATSSTSTSGAPAALHAKADRSVIRNDGKDLSFITVRVTDATGRTAPLADNRVRFSVHGPGEIVATDNGDPTNFEAFQNRDRAAFHGFVVAIVRALPGRTGAIEVRAESNGLKSQAIVVNARGGDNIP